MKSISRNAWSLKDFRFLFKPRSVFFLKKNSTNYRIYLQKDVQVIGTVQQLIPPMAPQIKYTLSQFNRPLEFRIATDPIPNYSIVLYQVSQTGIEQITEHYQLKISKFIEGYFNEFLSLDQQLFNELKSKQGNSLPQIWRCLSNSFSKKNFIGSVRFEKIEAIFEFVIEPIHHYDELVKEAEIEEQRRKQKRQKKQELGYFKSRSIPEFAENKAQLKRGYSEQQPPLKPFSFHTSKTQAEAKNIKEELKHFTIAIPNIKTKEDESTKTEKPFQDSQKKENYSLKENTMLQRIDEDQLEEARPIREGQERYLLMPEVKVVPKKKGKGNEEQYGEKSSSSTLGNLVIGLSVIASLMFVFFLMHPLSKT